MVRPWRAGSRRQGPPGSSPAPSECASRTVQSGRIRHPEDSWTRGTWAVYLLAAARLSRACRNAMQRNARLGAARPSAVLDWPPPAHALTESPAGPSRAVPRGRPGLWPRRGRYAKHPVKYLILARPSDGLTSRPAGRPARRASRPQASACVSVTTADNARKKL